MNRPRRWSNRQMPEALRRAASRDDPAARDMAFTLAEQQRDEQERAKHEPRPAPRQSPGYDRYVQSKGLKR